MTHIPATLSADLSYLNVLFALMLLLQVQIFARQRRYRTSRYCTKQLHHLCGVVLAVAGKGMNTLQELGAVFACASKGLTSKDASWPAVLHQDTRRTALLCSHPLAPFNVPLLLTVTALVTGLSKAQQRTWPGAPSQNSPVTLQSSYNE